MPRFGNIGYNPACMMNTSYNITEKHYKFEITIVKMMSFNLLTTTPILQE